ncbi:MAG: chromate transporter [Erysipelotrichaceae bacterium]|nr:chromate transporter [Erysipelotrichaceae bacterium]
MQEYIDLFVSWFKMGLFTFGGGYAMLPMIQKEVIEKHGWATESEVMDYYAIGQCTPGIIAVNAATFIGYKVKGVSGGIVATLGVVSPSLIIIFLISTLITNFSELEVVQHALRGIQVAVCVLMFVAIEKLLKNGVKDLPSAIIFLVALVLSLFTNLSTVTLVIMAAVAGYVLYVVREKKEGGQA